MNTRQFRAGMILAALLAAALTLLIGWECRPEPKAQPATVYDDTVVGTDGVRRQLGYRPDGAVVLRKTEFRSTCATGAER